MECQFETVMTKDKKEWAACWRIPGLPDMLDEGRLDEFTENVEELGPFPDWEIQDNHKDKRYKWNQRGPRHSRLIQLAFHDCLRYQNKMCNQCF